MKNIFKALLAVVVIVAVAGIGLTAFLYYRIYFPYQSDDTQQEFIIQRGEGVNQVSARLVAQGLIPDNFYIDTYLWLVKGENKLRAGTYSLTPAMSAKEIADKFISGDVLADTKVVIPEGWTREDIAQAFTEFHVKYYQGSEDIKAVASRFETDFLRQSSQVEQYRADYDFLVDLPVGATLEGYLFPDTYEVYLNSTPDDIIRMMLENFERKAGADLKKLAPGKKIFDTVNLAAIVEREVRQTDEMINVAGVYQNRLDQGMKLQSDATITFITKKKDPQPTLADTQIDSLYNTYLHAGLPPAPIGNPGLQAIRAAINPAAHHFFYFITKLDTGEAIFAETAEEHLENKKKYLD